MSPPIFHFDEAVYEQHLRILTDEDLKLALEKNKKSTSRDLICGVVSFCFLLIPITAYVFRLWVVEQKKQGLIFHEMESRGLDFLKGPMWDDLHEDARDSYLSGRVLIDDWEDVEDLRKRAFPLYVQSQS